LEFEKMQAIGNQGRFVRVLSAILIIGLAASAVPGLAQQASGSRRAGDASAKSAQDSVKIEPYTGPPIFLDEAEQIAKPKIVTHDTRKENYEDGKTLRVERVLALYSDNSFAADGGYREFYPNGKPFVTGQFKEGRQVGEWTYYFEDGQVNRKTNYSNGKLDGSWEVFRADGTLAAKRSFKDGERDGEWITYDATGKQKLSEEHYVKGERDGEWKSWYADGKPLRQVAFKNGKLDGKSTEWNDKGQKVIEVEYKNNQLDGTATRYLPDGKTTVQTYKEGRFISESK
jgi:antitoxin component YwqK of YwqJK toxin-antitoxin module